MAKASILPLLQYIFQHRRLMHNKKAKPCYQALLFIDCGHLFDRVKEIESLNLYSFPID